MKKENAENEDVPASLSDLQKDAFIRLVVTNEDSNKTFVQWRPAFYVAGDQASLKNFFTLLDGWFVYKENQMAREQAFEVTVYPHVNIAITEQDLLYKNYKWNSPSMILPLKVFEAQPCVGKNIVTVNVEPQSDHVVSLLISGNTYQYRARLDDYGVPQARSGDDKENRIYYRVLKNINLKDETQKKRILDMFELVFANLAMRLVVEPCEAGSSAETFLADLRKLPCLH